MKKNNVVYNNKPDTVRRRKREEIDATGTSEGKEETQ